MSNAREKLIELLDSYKCEFENCDKCPHLNVPGACSNSVWCGIADYLIANGVLVPPCKMGEPIYIVITKIPKPGFPEFTFIKRSRLTEHNFFRALREIGKTIFLTKEEAEAKKAQIEGDNICQED